MKKKHIGFIILLLVLLLGLSTDIYAYSIDDVQYFVNHLITNNVTNANYSSFQTRLTSLLNDFQRLKQIAIEQNINLSQYTCWRMASTGRGTSCHLFGFKTSPEYHCTGYWYETTNSNSTYEGILWSTDTNSWSTGNYRFSDDFCALNENEPTNGNYYNAIMQNRVEFPSVLVFTPYNDGDITVWNDGNSEQFLSYRISRSVNSWALGKIDIDDSMKIDARLSFFVPGTENYTSSIGHAQYYNGVTTTSGGLSITGDGVVYINNSNVYYNQGYNLSLDLEGENVGNYYIYFLPYGSTATSGELYSPDLDSNEYIDLIQNLQDLIALGTVDEIYDDNFGNSGDSGDVLLSTLDYKPYNNDYSSYMQTCFESLYEVISGSGDVSFSFDFMGTSMTVHSSDFTVPNSPLKYFVTTFLVFATVYYFYVQCSHFYHKLQEGDFEGATETLAINDESVLM